MILLDRRPKLLDWCGATATLAALVLSVGCASPGPPHAPSLKLPKVASDLTARRVGDRVELRFTAPSRTTDNLPLASAALTGVLCRQLTRGACIPVDGTQTVAPSRLNARSVAVWADVLPPDLAQGPVRLLGYRVELFNAAKQSAGRSDAAYTVAGVAPAPVSGLRAEGTRLGVLLQWQATPHSTGTAIDEVMLHREDLSAPATAAPQGKRESDGADLLASATDAAQGRVLDATAKPERAYRYAAVRRTSVLLGGHAIELSSALSEPVPFVLHLVYPPVTPTGLTAAGFTADTAAAAGYAVDLIWQPVDDAGLLAGLAGYNVYREGPAGRVRLNATPVPVSAFHDATAIATDGYRYSVTSLDGRGNESAPAVVVLEPDTRP